MEKLRAVRRYYDVHNVPVDRIRREAFKRLLEQMGGRMPEDDADISWMLKSTGGQIPLFPYRMQAVALWEEATNWRVLQASAHQDIYLSVVQNRNEERILGNFPDDVNIFDYCAE